jgi:hypothetical protein
LRLDSFVKYTVGDSDGFDPVRNGMINGVSSDLKRLKVEAENGLLCRASSRFIANERFRWQWFAGAA